MTVATKPRLTEELQLLIDARLDTIDRMLMGRVPRTDRMAILGETESQIHELLPDKGAELLDREEVLDVLRQLDPPEAYLVNEHCDRTSNKRPSTDVPTKRQEKSASSTNGEGRIGGILGMCSAALVVLYPLFLFLGSLLDSEPILYGSAFIAVFLGIVCSVISLVLSVRGRRQGALPIVGMVTCGITLPFWMISAAFILMSI